MKTEPNFIFLFVSLASSGAEPRTTEAFVRPTYNFHITWDDPASTMAKARCLSSFIVRATHTHTHTLARGSVFTSCRVCLQRRAYLPHDVSHYSSRRPPAGCTYIFSLSVGDFFSAINAHRKQHVCRARTAASGLLLAATGRKLRHLRRRHLFCSTLCSCPYIIHVREYYRPYEREHRGVKQSRPLWHVHCTYDVAGTQRRRLLTRRVVE